MDRTIGHRVAAGSAVLRRLLVLVGWALAAAGGSAFASEPCGTGSYPFPYTDVASVGDPFCPGIMEAYVTGISKGTTSTTFSPNDTVTRVAMTTFLQRSVDQVLARGSRRAALNQWWTPPSSNGIQTILVGGAPNVCIADGENIWTSILSKVTQVDASTGTVLGTWTGLTGGQGLIFAAGKIFVVGATSPGSLYVIDPTGSPTVATNTGDVLGKDSMSIAFDGTNLWTANPGSPGSVSIVSPQSPYTVVNTVTAGFNAPLGILYDGAHIWVTDSGAGTLLKLDSMGNVLQTVTVGTDPQIPVFDGTNIWVPNYADSSITVVQASTGNMVAMITSDGTNMLSNPTGATFDGERVLVTNGSGDSATVFKAADLSFIANVATGFGKPTGPCSDGINFWVNTNNLLRL